MKAAVPPVFWASAIVCSMSVVLPDDSGPKISMTRPRGSPPTPSARSSPREPVGMTGTSVGISAVPSFIIEPLPNCFSIWAIARSMARFFSSFSAIVFSSMQMSPEFFRLYPTAEGHFHQCCINRTARTELTPDQTHRSGREPAHRAILIGGENLVQHALVHPVANAGESQMRRECAGFLLKTQFSRPVLDLHLQTPQSLHLARPSNETQPDDALRARIREGPYATGLQRERLSRRGRPLQHPLQRLDLRFSNISQEFERQVEAVRVGPSDPDGKLAP